jgi:16S rRNA (adenine1518-N6/adenine1519-N6)-dimethyltransferase
VAERLAARPGDLSILGVTAQFFWEVGLKNVVEANMFTPPPKVDSQVVVLDYRSKPLFNDVDSVRFFRLVKLGFSAKRKTLLNSLAAGLRIDKQATSELIVEAGLDPNNRAQKLSLEDWYELYKVSTDKNLV